MVTQLQEQQANVFHLFTQFLDEKLGTIRTEMKALKDESRLDGEAKQTLERMQTDLAEYKRQLDVIAVAQTAPRGYDNPEAKAAALAAERKAAFDKALRSGFGSLNAEERKHVKHDSEYGIVLGEKMGHGQADEVKTLYAADMTTGGFLATPEYVNQLIAQVIEYSDMPALVETRYTSKPFVMTPKRTQTTSATRIAEQATRTETQNPKFGMIQTFPFEAYALTLVSRTDLDDSELDLGQYVMDDFATQFSKLVGNEILNGRGPAFSECAGLLNDSTITGNAITTAGSLAISYADLVKVKQTLRPPYRKGAAWLWTTETTGVIQSLTDTLGNPLWRPFGDTLPNTLFGYPYYEMIDMPQVAANKYAIAFGNYKEAYQYVIRKQVSTLVMNERYADQNAVGYMGFFRFGGSVKLPIAVQLLKIKP